ncbi:MAG: hypothetical protein QXS25_00515 [Candidatus Nitrosocaldus sp.]
MVNKLALGIAVTAIPLAVGIAAILGLFGSTGGKLFPDVRPDRQTPAVTEIKLVIRNVNGTDRLFNIGDVANANPNPAMFSCLACKLKLTITNNGQNTHTIVVEGTGASTGPIAPGETKSLEFSYNDYTTLKYRSVEHPDQISGDIEIKKIS